MKRINLIIVALAALALAGCMSYSTTVADKDGKQTQCSFSGYGIIGGAIAKSNYDECVAQAKEKK
jgi:hypothetical protein